MGLFKIRHGVRPALACALLGLVSGCSSDATSGTGGTGGTGGSTAEAGVGGVSASGGLLTNGGSANGGAGASAGGGAGTDAGGSPPSAGGSGPALKTGRFSEGSFGACGLDATGKILCFGFPDGPPSVDNLQISVGGDGSGCVLAADQTVHCWGYFNTSPTGIFSVIAVAGDSKACGITSAGTLSCWANAGDSTDTVPTGTFKSLATTSGFGFSCGIASDDTIKCWGSILPESIPSGTFAKVYAAGTRVYGLRATGEVVCNKQIPSAPTGKKYVQLAVGDPAGGSTFTCGIDLSGAVECWEGSTQVKAAPSGVFVDLVGGANPCGILQDGSLQCWGGVIMPPPYYRPF